jgi:lysophospholipase L1-like esterase
MHRPRVLIIGQSISLGYTPHVVELLSDAFEVHHNEGNAGQSDNILLHLDAWALSAPWDLIQLTAGLHDLARDKTSHQPRVPVHQFKVNLECIVERMQQHPARPQLLWATTTPILDARHNAHPHNALRYEEDHRLYRAAAAEVMKSHHIPINDLHAFVSRNDPDRLISDDGVHFTDEGYRFLAKAVADGIRNAFTLRTR